MIQIAILKYLNSSQELQNLIGKDRFFPVFAFDLSSPALEYQVRILKGGIIKQSQLSINIIWSDYDFILEIQECLNSLLDFNLPSEFITIENIKFNSRVSGSSTPLYRPDLKVYQINMNFIINWRTIE